jgi:hypothetical protein
MAERSQLRVSEGQDGRSERPATGRGQSRPTQGVASASKSGDPKKGQKMPVLFPLFSFSAFFPAFPREPTHPGRCLSFSLLFLEDACPFPSPFSLSLEDACPFPSFSFPSFPCFPETLPRKGLLMLREPA